MGGSQPYPKIIGLGGKVIDNGKHTSLFDYGNNDCRKRFIVQAPGADCINILCV
jgi:hypothetical protein